MGVPVSSSIRSFGRTLRAHHVALERRAVEILQINVGKLCNQACHHCHVEAGPKRTEQMDARTAARVVELIAQARDLMAIDLTGGAPELNANFRFLVRAARAAGKDVIDRCNLTVLLLRGQEDTAEFLAEERVTIVASLPCYSRERLEQQRGLGVFDQSIEALLRLNALGYGRPDSGLQLDLVYNPVGASLPPPQAVLEAAYKRELAEHFGIVFNRLLTITNMPIKRFRHQLEREGELAAYQQLLLDAFNPLAAAHVMCRSLVSVSWDGQLYDCDFNQMLEMPLGGRSRSVWDIARLDQLIAEPIACGDHCYACTAGAGSSCAGALL